MTFHVFNFETWQQQSYLSKQCSAAVIISTNCKCTNSHSPYRKIRPHTIVRGRRLNCFEEPSHTNPPRSLFNHRPIITIMTSLRPCCCCWYWYVQEIRYFENLLLHKVVSNYTGSYWFTLWLLNTTSNTVHKIAFHCESYFSIISITFYKP